MKIIDYDKLFAEFKPNGYVSEDAITIANMLIYDLCIQPGCKLARFLGVEPCFDNHMAMRIWVQKRLDENLGYVIEDMCNQLQSELYELLSPSGVWRLVIGTNKENIMSVNFVFDSSLDDGAKRLCHEYWSYVSPNDYIAYLKILCYDYNIKSNELFATLAKCHVYLDDKHCEYCGRPYQLDVPADIPHAR